jgi:hypothetical protein
LASGWNTSSYRYTSIVLFSGGNEYNRNTDLRLSAIVFSTVWIIFQNFNILETSS